MAASQPRLRTCIATRKKVDESQLLRVVVDRQATARELSRGGQRTIVVADPHRKKPGRGAWITPTMKAVTAADKTRAFARALKISGPVDISSLMDYLTAQR